MKLNFGSLKRSQPDPFIFEDDGKYYNGELSKGQAMKEIAKNNVP